MRHVGDAIAFVVAETIEQARDAAEAIAVEWEPKPHVVDAAAALNQGAAPVWPDRPGNLAFATTMGDEAATKAAFASAARTVSLALVNQRLVTNYLDTRGVVAEYDAAADRTTLTLSSQGSHAVRDVLCEILDVAPERLRVVTPDVGGGFGTKLFTYREYALVAVAAQRLNRPVRWISERIEHFVADAQGRDNITTARLALDENNRFLALEVDLIADMGAYLSAYAPFIPFIGAGMLPGVYDIPACHIRIRGAYTNTVPVDAYRGAGRPEAAYVIERLVDVAARDLGLAPDALRRKNFIKPKAMPYATQTGKTYDSGDFAGHMARAQEIGDWAGFKGRAAQSKKQGKLRGIGLATYIEACGNNGPDPATVRLEQDGTHHGSGRLAVDRPGAPDRVCPARGAASRRRAGTGARDPGRHRRDRKGRRDRRLELDLVRRRVGCRGLGQARREAQGACRRCARGRARRCRDRRRSRARGRHGSGDLVLRDRAVGRDAPRNAHRVGLRRAGGPDLSQRDAPVRGRDRSGQRRDSDRQLCRGGRLRRHPQSAAAGRAGPRRSRAGDRPGPDGAHRLRCRVRPIGQRLADGLRAAARVRLPDRSYSKRVMFRPRQHARRQGRRRSGRNRLLPGTDECDCRRACGAPARIRHVDMPATPERVWQAIEEGRRLHTL